MHSTPRSTGPELHSRRSHCKGMNWSAAAAGTSLRVMSTCQGMLRQEGVHAGATPGGRAIAGLTATPSVAGTPLRTPGGRTGGAFEPHRTPMRDALGLNDPDALLEGESRREARAREAAASGELKAGVCLRLCAQGWPNHNARTVLVCICIGWPPLFALQPAIINLFMELAWVKWSD